jgi:uncharacterized heparinase superfamily protein
MKGGHLRRWLRTGRLLRPTQVAGQLRHRLRGTLKPRPAPTPAPVLRSGTPSAAFLPAPAHARFVPPARLRLLNREVDLGDPIDWRFSDEGPLFAYHLHQFDALRAPELATDERTRLVLDWIARCDGGAGWDPHPTCLRLATWIKLWLTPGALSHAPQCEALLAESLASQAATLAGRLETHLLGNHYLSNLIGLVLAGLVFRGPAARGWLAQQERLGREVRTQVLPDGVHEERSPMYHSLLLEALLDVLNVGRTFGNLDPTLEAELVEATGRMLAALRILSHPDGEIALLADSAFGIAQPPVDLEAYAASLGVAAREPARPGLLEVAGYARLDRAPFVLIASLAGPMPAHQPGHAHCDALAFELSLGTERVVTDSGVAEYLRGTRREWSRATRSHATLEVGGLDQAELWAAHRVGGRPEVRWLSAEPDRRIEATCAGWATPKSLHRRVFELRDGLLEIHDTLEGRGLPVRLGLPLAPGISVALDGDLARLELPSGTRLAVELPRGARWTIESGWYFPEFGRSLDRSLLVGRSDDFRKGTWRLRVLA